MPWQYCHCSFHDVAEAETCIARANTAQLMVPYDCCLSAADSGCQAQAAAGLPEAHCFPQEPDHATSKLSIADETPATQHKE